MERHVGAFAKPRRDWQPAGGNLRRELQPIEIAKLVLDPFLGSGTTAVVAQKLGRQFVGVEIDTTYCCLAQKRLHMASSDRRIQGYEDGVFWERNAAGEATPTLTAGMDAEPV
ncbi:MAG: hypothetical protein DYG88_05485 [Chloroflexi bacterium CFX4]|nr:hypothetical protein [Chloroflexi bacterium CFX4]MDL1923969.1 site-specific DNA-methyltransferase [Chloroflexi bacterium CFX3]